MAHSHEHYDYYQAPANLTKMVVDAVVAAIPDDKPEDIIDELTYRSYRFNRLHAPEISPEDWARVFKNVPLMEQRFQQEK